METPQNLPMPKKSCMITIMFPIQDDKEALSYKEAINAAIEDIKEKRYTFQIIET